MCRFACATIVIVFFLRARARFCASDSLTTLVLEDNQIGDEGTKAIAVAVAASGSLTLKTLDVDSSLRGNTDLVAACASKGVVLQ